MALPILRTYTFEAYSTTKLLSRILQEKILSSGQQAPERLSPETEIRVRLFQKSDTDAVRALFEASFGYLDGSLLRRTIVNEFMTQASIITPTLLFGLVFLNGTHLGMVVILNLIVAFLSLHSTHMAYKKFIASALHSDLLHIEKHYDLATLEQLGSAEIVRNVSSEGVKGGFWVAEAVYGDSGDTEIVGCVGLDARPNFKLIGSELVDAELRRMAISPMCRRRGVGGQLIKAVIAHAKFQGMKSILSVTSFHQTSAIKLYEKHGWVRKRNSFWLGKILVTDLVLYLADI